MSTLRFVLQIGGPIGAPLGPDLSGHILTGPGWQLQALAERRRQIQVRDLRTEANLVSGR